MLTKEKAMQIKPLLENEDFNKELLDAGTIEEQRNVFMKHGVAVEREDLKDLADAIDSALSDKDTELSESDLENVAGGIAVELAIIAGVVIIASAVTLALLLRTIRKGLAKSKSN